MGCRVSAPRTLTHQTMTLQEIPECRLELQEGIHPLFPSSTKDTVQVPGGCPDSHLPFAISGLEGNTKLS